MSYILSEIEKSLVEGCLRQDRLVQKAVYERYKNAMYTICYRVLNDSDLAHDALQEAFVEVFTKIHTFQQLSSLGAWIKTIVYRKAIKHIRLQVFEEIEETKHDSVVAWQDGLTGEYLQKAIDRLPNGCKAVFLMIEVDGYSHKETAEILGISEGTSKSQLFHAKKLLQKSLKELYV